MRKVFLFWSVILVILIAGTIAIVRGRILLKKEMARSERIKKEIAASLKAEAYKMPEYAESQEAEKSKIMKAGQVPQRHRSPTMPRLYKPLED